MSKDKVTIDSTTDLNSTNSTTDLNSTNSTTDLNSIKGMEARKDKVTIDSKTDLNSIKDMEARKEEVKRRRRRRNDGPLSLNPDDLEKGFQYYIAKQDSFTDEVPNCEQLGYEVVRDNNIIVGQQSLTSGRESGSAVTVALGKDKNGNLQKGILMKIPDELWEANQDVEREKVRKLEEEIGKPKDGMSSVIFEKR